MELTTQEPLPAVRPASALRIYYKAVENAIYKRLYNGLSSFTPAEIEQVITEHQDLLVTHPGLKENMRLTAISVGGDTNDVMLEFTDVTLGVEYWSFAMQDIHADELITLIETCQTIRFI